MLDTIITIIIIFLWTSRQIVKLSGKLGWKDREGIRRNI